jgi:hypothetical protein
MSNPNKIASLKTLSSDLLDKALAEIRLHRKESSPPNEDYFFIAEYFLQEAMEYVNGAFEMIELGKSNASIALSRWVLEASLNLHWTVADSDKIDERLNILQGEAWRNEACLQEGLAKLYPKKSQQFLNNAIKARKNRKDLGVEKPDDLYKRLESIEKETETNWPNLYPLYRICCASAHPKLNVWERFGFADGTIVSKDPNDKQSIACWMAVASTFYLTIFTYKLTELDNSKQLKELWEKKIRPLLNDD